MKVVYKITYPNGKIYVGQDVTDSALGEMTVTIHDDLPDEVISCYALAVSVRHETQCVGITYLAPDGRKVLLAMPGALLRRMRDEIDSTIETAPEIETWGCNAPIR